MATQVDGESPKDKGGTPQSAAVTAGIIVIGDEILKGFTQDTNSFYMCQKLRSLGVKVAKISVVPDQVEAIATEVKSFADRFTYVLTSGGIGPTHDDVTFEAVAEAFGEKIRLHPEMVELVKKFFGQQSKPESPKMKLACVPESSLLNYGVDEKTGRTLPYPLISVRNVYIFPGIPSLMKRALDGLQHLFRNEKTQFYMREIYVNVDETRIASVLNDTNGKFWPRTNLGSYPDWVSNYHRVKLILDSDSEADLDEAHAFLMANLPRGVVVPLIADPVSRASTDVYGLAESGSPLGQKVAASLRTIEEGLESYSLSKICIGFNGGKDCTALLHLSYAVVQRCLAFDPALAQSRTGIRNQPPVESRLIFFFKLKLSKHFKKGECMFLVLIVDSEANFACKAPKFNLLLGGLIQEFKSMVKGSPRLTAIRLRDQR
ncbi:PREDICTED: FAD synthase-like [Thamnophis sirtalis]|uniref:FAD synthase-like n=1 Tax=Thamnophis sirtalis TaxID=35019 RepID=A0A6I9YBV6_9SAUR|nr:PREDICTED: FAD synthase-like [Thamnophis sirtalis]XP_013921603.1 PREDICTED: FAD synthase-like [Thamnophis sirtalis]